MFELNDDLQSGYYKSHVGYDNVDWIVDEAMKLENNRIFSFKITEKDIILTEKDEEGFESNHNCQFCEEEVSSNKITDHCHLKSKNRDPAHQNCNINFTKKRSAFVLFVFHICSN